MTISGFRLCRDPKQVAMSNPIFDFASCVTVALNVSVGAAAAAFGVDLTAEPLCRVDAWSDSGEPLVPLEAWSDITASFVPIDGGVLIAELTSSEGVREEVLSRLAVDGPAGSGYWPAGGGGVWFAVAAAGRARQYLLGDGIPIDPEDAVLFSGVDLANTYAAAVELLARSTGISITPEMIDRVTEFWPVVPVLDSPAAPAVPLHLDPLQKGFWRGDIDVNMCGAENVDRVLQWTDAEQRDLCFWAAREALARTDLLGEPALLAMLDHQGAPAVSPEAELIIRNIRRRSLKDALSQDFDNLPPDWRIIPRQVDAVGALLAAVTTPDTLDALGGTMVGARMSFYPDQDTWCHTLTQRLTSPPT